MGHTALHPENLAKRLVSIAAAAEYAGVSAKTIRRRVADGTIPARRLGTRCIRVRLSDVDAALRPIPTTGGDSRAS